MVHKIKCWPQYFERVLTGEKTFEIRENDRGYQAGDDVEMLEFDPKKMNTSFRFIGPLPGKYTGRRVVFRIGYVLPIDEERVVFSILNLKEVHNESP